MQIPFQPSPRSPPMASKESAKITLSVILAASFCSLLFIFSLPSSTLHAASSDPYLFPPSNISSLPSPPSFAYLLSGSSAPRLLRLLYATYHPNNHYLLHLDPSASDSDRDKLASTILSIAVFKAAKNVDVIGKPDHSNPDGSSSISATLHGAAILLRLSPSWNWFINLRAGDYPLVTQDDLLHIFSYIPKDFNFVAHSSYIGWRESKKMRSIIVDPGLYLTQETYVYHATQTREFPNAFRLFNGSSAFFLSRSFTEHCILGTDNLPRTLLMYLANTPYSLGSYFPTILCNTRGLSKTVVNHSLTVERTNGSGFKAMVRSGAAFATGFEGDDSVLDQIDKKLLGRRAGRVVPGGWCLGKGNLSCASWGRADVLRPGDGATRLENGIVEFLDKFRSQQCSVES